jgi:uncharacterized membrane protein YraQ (UPF0718 family)
LFHIKIILVDLIMFKFLQNKRLIIALLLSSVIASIFWSQSRIPALNEKAQMGLRTNFSDLAFEVILPVTQTQPVFERIVRSSINWAYTNMLGMLFGLLFAAAILTVLSSIKKRTFKQPWLNTVSGVLVGAPLGVCVNCATPIAFGIYSAGARLETALASLVSSPTLNIIVLTMSFTLLPWEMAFIKLIGVLLLLSTIPFLVKRFTRSVTESSASTNIPTSKFASELSSCSLQANQDIDESYYDAALSTLGNFIKHLFYIVKFALPLMLLAGFLGALVIELVPFNIFENAGIGFFIVLSCAIVATILPVPIAFDVIVVMALLANGIDKGIATVLLFALGVYSIYPAFIIARYISVRLSIAFAITVIFISSGLGLLSQVYFDKQSQSEQIEITKGLSETNESIYKQAIHICENLPAQLQSTCFEKHIDQFNDIVSYETMCLTRPSALKKNDCKNIINTFIAKQSAFSDRNTNACMTLTTRESQSRCIYYATVRSAIKEYDISLCNKLINPESIDSCRTDYLNANLLFNPDGGACKDLSDQELHYCKINADIYKLTDTMDIDGCNELNDKNAIEHCRYTVASAMIGRHNDVSGCSSIQSPELSERCKSLSIAWKAANENSSDLCWTLKAVDLKNTCLLRIADKQIKTLLVNHTLTSSNDSFYASTKENKDLNLNQTSSIETAPLEWKNIYSNHQFKLSFTAFAPPVSEELNRFKKLSGDALGINQSWSFRMTDFFEPFIVGKGIASGDYNNDMWPDIVLATEHGVLLYKNIGGQFEKITINQGEMQNANLFIVAFVDADNDGLQDIFASAYSGKNYLLINKDGNFENSELISLEGDHRLTLSAGFGDINEDGELDIVLGNWSSGVENLFSPVASDNRILFRDGNSYRTEKINDIKGETNSVLIADINDDGLSDLLIGNDRLIPDMYYLNDGQGMLKLISHDNDIVPLTPMFTMSIDAADFNNDLKPDLFSTDMTFARSSQDDYCSVIQDLPARDYCEKTLINYKNFQEGSAVTCEKNSNILERQECYIAFSIKAAKELKDTQFCSNLPDKSSAYFSLCQFLASPVPPEESNTQKTSLPQEQRNILLMQTQQGFTESAESFGVSSSYWSWNSKAADLDNDGWQDIYVGNGFHFGDNFYEVQENILFRNINGIRFEQLQKEWGLNDTINTPSYTYLDIDLDGDLDIITTGVLAPPRIYLNQLDKKNSIMFSLHDEQGNSFGIGAKVTIRYGDNKQFQQKKENKLSGGFMSFDNPVIHFGLDMHAHIEQVQIQWSDGEITLYDKPLPATGIYKIHRQAQ